MFDGGRFKGVYVNEDLTKFRSGILFDARKLTKERRIYGAWSSNGTILLKDNFENVHKIVKDADLAPFKTAVPQPPEPTAPTHHKGKKLPSVHVLGDFNFKDVDWPDRLSKSGSTLSQPEGQILIDIMNDHGLEQMVHFPTQEKNILDLILTTLPGQFQDVHSPDKLSDHDIVSGTLKIFTPPPQ